MYKTNNLKHGINSKIFYSFINSILILLFLLQSNKINAQDTILPKVVKKHSPAMAAWFSTAIPGLGQAYNKKYWKIPIIYAGMATSLYYVKYNNDKYLNYKRIYSDRLKAQTDTSFKITELTYYTDDNIKTLKDGYRRNMEFSYIITGLIYILNIVDASVDAHFYTYDVNENLAVKIEPRVIFKTIEPTPTANITLTYKFKYK